MMPLCALLTDQHLVEHHVVHQQTLSSHSDKDNVLRKERDNIKQRTNLIVQSP